MNAPPTQRSGPLAEAARSLKTPTKVRPEDTTDRPLSILDAALELAESGWPVLPLGRSKRPRIPKHDACKTSRCAGGCGRDGHGVKDGTTDLATVRRWFGTDYPDALVGTRVPDQLMVIDIDPRHDGERRWMALLDAHNGGRAIGTLTVWSGRGDGGRHYYFLRPPGRLSEAGLKRELRRLGVLADGQEEAGLDLKAAGGYTVLPPSLHPATRRPYTWETRPPEPPPPWLVDLLVVKAAPVPAAAPSFSLPARTGGVWDMFSRPAGVQVADEFCARTTWADILTPHRWETVGADTEGDGAQWRHPHATNSVSATVRHDCLFVYSSNTPFEVTTTEAANGYTKFRAYAVLNHAGNLSAAAREIAQVAA